MDVKLFQARFLLVDSRTLIQEGAVAVEGGRILNAGPGAELHSLFPKASVREFGEAVLMPPMANAHCHLELTDFPRWSASHPPSPKDASFVDWIRRLIPIKHTRSPQALGASLGRGLALCLRAGTGAVGDILSFVPGRDAYRRSPLFGRLYYETLGLDDSRMGERIRELEALVGEGPKGRFTPGISPHSPYNLSRSYLKALATLAQKRGLPLSIHLAESPAETEFLLHSRGEIATGLYPFVGWGGMVPAPAGQRPLPYVLELGLGGADCLFVHGVQLSDEEPELLAKSGATLVLCPRSNAALGVGRAPVEALVAAGVPLALGTDSLASAPSLSLWDELAFLRERTGPEVGDQALLEMATLGGARALGLDGEMGRLAPGWGAHFQVLRPPRMPGGDNLLARLCRSGKDWPLEALYLGGVNRLQKS